MRSIISISLIFTILTICLPCSPAVAGEAIHFGVLGDRASGHVPGIYGEVLTEMLRLRPDFIVTVGDMIEGHSDDTASLNQKWQELKDIVSISDVPIHYTVGNNDIESQLQEDMYKKWIGEPNTTFDYKNLHFILFDNARWETSAELPPEKIVWLENALKNAPKDSHIFVFMHIPYWYNEVAMGKPDPLHELFVTYGVDGVFTGHYHEYFSGEYDGVKYTGVGSSGGGVSPGPSGVTFHFCWVTVDDDGLSIAPVKMGAVLPWNEVTAPERLAVSNMKMLGITATKVKVDELLRHAGNSFAVTIHNMSADQQLADTLRWDDIGGWTIDPVVRAIDLAPGAEGTYEFTARCVDDIYPLPESHLDFTYGPNKVTDIMSPLLIARQAICPRAKKIKIDGKLDDAAWEIPVDRFYAGDGSDKLAEPSQFYYAYDDKNLYIGAKCHESDMSKLMANVSDHDGPVYGEDCIGFFIQPDLTKKVAYQIYFNPKGVAFDQKLTIEESGYASGDRGWNGSYKTKSQMGDDFWSIEIAIPLSAFGAQIKPGDRWGLNFRRKQKRLNAVANWQVPIDYDPKTFGVLQMH